MAQDGEQEGNHGKQTHPGQASPSERSGVRYSEVEFQILEERIEYCREYLRSGMGTKTRLWQLILKDFKEAQERLTNLLVSLSEEGSKAEAPEAELGITSRSAAPEDAVGDIRPTPARDGGGEPTLPTRDLPDAPEPMIIDSKMKGAELAKFVASLSPPPKLFDDMRAASDGTAPRGFASAVRQVAHRSIARAGVALDRAAIMRELSGAGVPLPNNHALVKVTKILSTDPGLTNLRGEGYRLVDQALWQQLGEIRAETDPGRVRGAP